MDRIIVAGGIGGGALAASRARMLDEQAEILILERGEYIAFKNCIEPYYTGIKTSAKSPLRLQTADGFKRRFAADFRFNHEIVSVDCAKKTVTVKDLENGNTYEEKFDRLILSPYYEEAGIGDEAGIPAVYRLREFARESRPLSAAIIGGGLFGAEIAENLKKEGVEVSRLEYSDYMASAPEYISVEYTF